MNVRQELQRIRDELMRADATIAGLMRRLEISGEVILENRQSENYVTIYPITATPAIFKGKKPTVVIFGDEQVEARTWKMVTEEIMKRCNADPEKHAATTRCGRCTVQTTADLG